MKKQNRDATDSMSDLKIAALTMFLLEDEYTVGGKTQNDLTTDVLNTQSAVDNLLMIQAKAIARIEIIERDGAA